MIIAAHRPDRAPNQRFRFEQYLPYLEEHGFHCHLSFLLDETDDKVLYSKGNFHRKANILRRNYLHRMRDLKKANDFDIIFICREALMTRSTFFEKAFSKSRAKIIYDFDDAIWMNDTSNANRLFAWMKNPGKISRSIGFSDIVFAGNKYLRDFALQFNKRVIIVPTTIDTGEYIRIPEVKASDKIVIGWSGSMTTIKHFELAIPFLKRIKSEFQDRVMIKVIGDASYRNTDLDITGIGWKKQDEISELSEIDIGIMPLPDDPWARGKCGLKGLQYMALGIPTIMSPVGVNQEIIQHGFNGLLASTEEEWYESIKILILDLEKRKSLGFAARKTVEEHYSVEANKHIYLQAFRSLVN